jgi:perosamine synthetase
MIPISKPYYDEREEEAVIRALRSKWVGLGPITEEFEDKFAKKIGAKYAVAVNSCTAALHLAAHILDLKPEDNIIVPTMTFLPTGGVANYCGATPIWCDIDEETLLIDWQDAVNRMNRNTKAIFPVLYAGQIVDSPPYIKVPLVFDCAQAVGARFDVTGKLCCWSFQAVKNLATGDGGMITTDDFDVCERVKRLRWFGIDKTTWQNYQNLSKRVWGYPIEEIGYKYNMNDITASIGLVQLDKLDEMQSLRKQLAIHYHERLKGIVRLLPILNNSSYYIMVIRSEKRNELSTFLNNNGIATQVHHKPVHLYPFYYKYSLPVAEKAWQEILTLPLFAGLKISEVDFICDKIIEFLRK